MLGKIAADARNFVLGLAGLAAVRKQFDEIIQRIERMIQLRNQITREGLGVRETTLPLAAQLINAGESPEDAQRRAVKFATQIAQGGVSLATATSLGVAADVNLPGGLRGDAAQRNVGNRTSRGRVRGWPTG